MGFRYPQLSQGRVKSQEARTGLSRIEGTPYRLEDAYGVELSPRTEGTAGSFAMDPEEYVLWKVLARATSSQEEGLGKTQKIGGSYHQTDIEAGCYRQNVWTSLSSELPQ